MITRSLNTVNTRSFDQPTTPLIILDIGAKFTAISKVLDRATAVEPFKLPDHINIDVPPGANNNHQNVLLN